MIRQVDLDRLQVPLQEPYRLSSVTVESFDISLVRVQTEDGSRGVGEITCLEGYSDESGDQAWKHAQTVGEKLPGVSIPSAISMVESELGAYPFSETGLVSALETAADYDWPTVTAPVVGILSADDPADERHRSLARQINEGLETIKVKVGFDPVSDAIALQRLLDDAPAHVTFRVDANQGYSLADAQTFLTHLSSSRIEHLEQPLPVGNLDSHASLTATSDIAIILDEEVATAEDLRRVDRADAADGVKFKLMKCGGPRNAVRLLEDATERGLSVIFGNGVQSEIGCLLEAAVWTNAGLTTAGEFNGWRKQSTAMLSTAIEFQDGSLHWDGSKPVFDQQRLSQYRTDSVRFAD